MANTILQLSAMELNQSIENELLENPALEILEDSSCSGDCVDPATCPFCPLRKDREERKQMDVEILDSGDLDNDYETTFGFHPVELDEDYDPLGNLEAEMTLQEHLRGLLRTA